MTDKLLVSIDELARALRLSRRWLMLELKAGRIPHLQAGRRRVFNVEAVRNALESRAAGGQEAARG